MKWNYISRKKQYFEIEIVTMTTNLITSRHIFVLFALIGLSLEVRDQSLSFSPPTNTFKRCYMYEESLKILCTDSAYQVLMLDILEDQIVLNESYQFSSNEFIVSRYFYFHEDLKEIILVGDEVFRIFALDNGTFTLRWEFNAGKMVQYYKPVCQMQGILFTTGDNFYLISNTSDQSQTIVESDKLIRGASILAANVLSSDTYFYSFQNTTNFVEILHFGLSLDRITYVSEARIPTSHMIRKFKSAFSDHGEFFAFFENGIIRIYRRNQNTSSYQEFQNISWNSQFHLKKIQIKINSLHFYCNDSITGQSFLKNFEISSVSSKFVEVDQQKLSLMAIKDIHFFFNYTFLSSSTEVKVLYECPKGCIKCNAHRQCLGCENGLKLEQQRCRKYDECFEYFDNTFSTCKKFCDKECKFCGEQPKKCVNCNQFSQLKEEQCLKKHSGISYLVSYLVFEIFRIPRFRTIYILVENLELYLYHHKEYDGALKKVLDTIHAINQLIEQLLMSNEIEEKTQMSNLSQYNHFTNPRFLRVERKSQLFFLNYVTSDCIQMILRVIAFCIMALLFKMLFNFEVSQHFRMYSFKIYLLELIFCQNIATVAYLVRENIKFLLRIRHSWMEYGALTFCVTFSTVSFVASSSIMCFYHIFYGKFIKYFYTNLYRRPGAFVYTNLKYFLKPMLLGLIHATYSDDQKFQLLALMGIQLGSAFLTLFFSIKYDIFRAKIPLTISFSFDCLMSLLNFLAYLKLLILEEEIMQMVQKGIFFCILGLIIGCFLEFFVFILEKLCTEPLYMPVEEKKSQMNQESFEINEKKQRKIIQKEVNQKNKQANKEAKKLRKADKNP